MRIRSLDDQARAARQTGTPLASADTGSVLGAAYAYPACRLLKRSPAEPFTRLHPVPSIESHVCHADQPCSPVGLLSLTPETNKPASNGHGPSKLPE